MSAELLPWLEDTPPRAVRERVALELAAGRIVAMPTETVYGLFARADDPAAIARLDRLKQRAADKAFTWHIGRMQDLERFPSVSALARRLARKYWPGPLTLVLPGVPRGLERAASNGWTGVRLPAHAATAGLLAEAAFPVVGTSANPGGAAALASAAEIQAAFGEAVALVLDGGKPPLQEASVVLRVGPGHFDILRPGILDLPSLRRTAGRRLGFVCTGNTCRSPMAEAMARRALGRALQVADDQLEDFGFELTSMGVFAFPGAPASSHAVAVLARRDIDLSEHRAAPAVMEHVLALDQVYALTQAHLDVLRQSLPPGRDGHCVLLDPHGRDIADPVGGPYEEYQRCADEIERAVRGRLGEWI